MGACCSEDLFDYQQARSTPDILKNDKNLGRPGCIPLYLEFTKPIENSISSQIFYGKNKISNEPISIKVVSKCLQHSQNSKVSSEIEILRGIDHPNIGRLYGVFEDSIKYYIIKEHYLGKDLFKKFYHIKHSFRFYTEQQIAKYMMQILRILGYLHHLNICHRDFRLENLVLQKATSEIKLKDLTYAVRMKDSNERLSEIVGSRLYMAPEVLRNEYGMKSDIWSAGVIMYILFTGKPPFYSGSSGLLHHKILYKEVEFNDPVWKRVSESAKDLIKALLNKNDVVRVSAQEALKHDWFRILNLKPVSTLKQFEIESIINFNTVNSLHRQVLIWITKHMNNEDIKRIKQVFLNADLNTIGMLSMLDLETIFKEAGYPISKEVLRIVFNKLANAEGKITYSNFIAASSNITENFLRQIFDQLDLDRDGFITASDLMCTVSPSEVPTAEFQTWVGDMDKDKKGYIDYDQFCRLLNSNIFLKPGYIRISE
jgi:calcium-dependent protein kinase